MPKPQFVKVGGKYVCVVDAVTGVKKKGSDIMRERGRKKKENEKAGNEKKAAPIREEAVRQAAALLQRLQYEARAFDQSSILERLMKANDKYKSNPTAANKVALYNVMTLNELIRAKAPDAARISKFVAAGENVIDESLITGMEKDLNAYLDAHMEGNENYKKVIRLTCLYLRFVVCKTLHPPGMFSQSGEVKTIAGKAVCPVRKSELEKPGSLCRWCVATTGGANARMTGEGAPA